MSHPHRVYLPYFHVDLSCIPRLSLPSKHPTLLAHPLNTSDSAHPAKHLLSHMDSPRIGIMIRIHSGEAASSSVYHLTHFHTTIRRRCSPATLPRWPFQDCPLKHDSYASQCRTHTVGSIH